MEKKYLGSDWTFFLVFTGTGTTPIDLNGYTYSYIITDAKRKRKKSGSGTINASGTELAISISGSETIGYSPGKMLFEFKLQTPGSNIFISDVVEFEAENTLHRSHSE